MKNQPDPDVTPVPPVFVDRDAEWSALNTWWQRVSTTSRSALVAIEGVPGIGKSALLGVWAESVRSVGAVVLEGRGDALPEAPLSALRTAIDSVPLDELREKAQIAWRQVHAILGDSAPDPSAGSITSALLTFLEAAGGGGPVLVAIDDLQHVDEDTLQVLTNLARTGAVPLLLVVTVRPRERAQLYGFEGFLRHQSDIGRAHRLVLKPFSREAVARLVQADPRADPADADALFASTGGNPMLMRLALDNPDPVWLEVAAQPSPGELSEDGTAPIELPPALLQHLLPEGSPSAVVAARLAMLGALRSDALALLAELSDLPPRETSAVVESLVARGIVERRRHRLTIPHLLRGHLMGMVSGTEQAQTHLGIADHLVQQPALPETGSHLHRLFSAAIHLQAAGRLETPAQVETLFTAATAAMWISPTPAAAWFELLHTTAHADEDLRSLARIRHLQAMLYSGQSEKARSLCRALLEEQGPEERDPLLVMTGIGLALVTGDIADLLALVAQVPDDSMTDFIDAAAALALVLNGRTGDALPHYLRALATMTLREENPEALTVAFLFGAAAMMGRPLTELQRLADHADAVIASAPPVERATVHSAVAMHEPHLPAALRLPRVADAVEQAIGLGGIRMIDRHLHDYLHGRWDNVTENAPSDIELLRSSGNRMAANLPAACAALVQIERGRAIESESMLARAAAPENTFHGPLFAIARAGVHRARGELDAAVRHLETVYRQGPDRGIVTLHTMVADTLVEVLLDLGESERAREVARQSMELVRPLGVPLLDAYGMLAVATSSGEPAAAKAALALARRHDLPLIQARSRLILADADESPEQHLSQAHRIFTELDASVRRAACEDRLRRHGWGIPRAGSHTLSTMESAIVRAVTAGRTNREIAAELHYSIKTIELRLSQIYARTGLSGRVELVRAAGAGELRLQNEQGQS